MHSYPTSQPAVLGVAAFGFATRGVFRVREGAGLARCRLCYPNSGLCYPPYAGTLILAYAGYRGGGAMVSHDENCCLMVESSPPRFGNWLILDPPGLLGYAVPPGGILKLPSYLAPLISADMPAVGGFVRRRFCL